MPLLEEVEPEERKAHSLMLTAVDPVDPTVQCRVFPCSLTLWHWHGGLTTIYLPSQRLPVFVGRR